MWALPEDTSDILLKDADGIRKAEKGGGEQGLCNCGIPQLCCGLTLLTVLPTFKLGVFTP